MNTAATLPRRTPFVLADLIPGSAARDLILVVGGAGLVGLLAQVSIHLSFTPIPITGQTLGVLLTGTALGWRRGLAAMVLYAVAGLVGVPWFAGHASGWTFPGARAEARRLAQGGGLRLNDKAEADAQRTVTLADLGPDGVIKLAAGKKKIVLVKPV